MKSIIFEGKTWNIYEDIRKKDKVLHKNICRIIKDLQRNDPTKGLGKPESLKHNLEGFWSRRISQKDKIIYSLDSKSIHIFALGGHYDNIK